MVQYPNANRIDNGCIDTRILLELRYGCTAVEFYRAVEVLESLAR